MNGSGIMNFINGTIASFKGHGIYTSPNAIINVDNAVMKLTEMQYTSMMAEAYATLNVKNNSNFYIENAIEPNGITGFKINVDDSRFSVTDCERQGLVKCDLILTSGATADISKNGTGYNMYSYNTLLVSAGTTLTMNENKSRALMTQGNGQTDVTVEEGGTLIVRENGRDWYATDSEEMYYAQKSAISIGVYGWYPKYEEILIYRNDIVNFEDGAIVDISDNYVRGISNFGTMYIGDTTVIKNNVALDAAEVETDRRVAVGGGIYNANKVTLADGVQLYNNHANSAADDIYNEDGAMITFGATGEGWALDGEPDCTDDIDGWYDDSADNRWEAHDEQNNHIIKVAMGTIATKKALKAAHGKNYEAGEVNPVDWEKSKSKTATALDENFESKVTLSLPSASYKGNLDVAFVLDGSTSADEEDLAAQAANLLDELSKIENLNVKASLTIFGGSQSILEDTGLLDISDTGTLQELKAKLTDPSYDKMDGRSGSNLQAGVEAARAHLNNDKTVDSADKYMIILSDGAARMWYENGQAMSQTYLPDKKIFWNSNEDFIKRYNIEGVALRTFSEVWTAGQSGVAIDAYGMSEAEKDAATADDPKVASWNIVATDSDYYTTYEVATYYAATSIVKAADEANVILVSYPYHTGTNYATYTESFKSWLAENKVVTRYDNADMNETQIFSAVKDELIYLVDAGSKVVDVIGYDDTYNNGMGYHFDFVNDIAKLNLTVDGTNLDAVQLSTNSNETVYGFGGKTDSKDGKTYPYVLHYYPKGISEEADEHFVWEINVPVKVNEPVQLTYSVKLTDPTSTAGTYTELYTNNSATLYPVDSNGNSLPAEEFAKPTVAYTVKETTPGNPPSDGGSDSYDGPYSDDPSTEIPDPDVPLTEPDIPPVVIEAPDVPLVDVPGEPVVEIEEPEVPLGDAPKTGDTAPMVAFAGLMAAAVVGLIITRRKFN